MARKTWHYAVTFLLPLVSIFAIGFVVNSQDPGSTGLAVLEPQPVEQVDAELSIVIGEGEFIPILSFVQIRYNGQLSSLPLNKITAYQDNAPEIIVYKNPELNYVGRGILGPLTLYFPLSAFDIDRTLTQEPIEITFLHNTRVIGKTVASLKE